MMIAASRGFPRRWACALALVGYLSLGMVGCGSDSGPATGPGGPLPQEAVQANKNMEDFMKYQPKK